MDNRNKKKILDQNYTTFCTLKKKLKMIDDDKLARIKYEKKIKNIFPLLFDVQKR